MDTKMTESEAKQKWCPMVRFHVLEGISAWSNKLGTGKIDDSTDKCIGSACMMWRTNAQSDDTPIRAIGLTIKTENALVSEGINTVGQLSKLDDRAILYMPLIGRKSLAEIRGALGDIDNVEGRRINLHGYCGLAGKL
jgi:hypothetical protein